MKVRLIAKRASILSRRATAAYERPADWHPSYIEGGWDDDWDEPESDYWEQDDYCQHGVSYANHCEVCDDEVGDIDKCMGCGRYYGTHWGLSAWSRDNGVAPQLCHKCWREHGYPWPESTAA
jgi:hypothetical protein